MEGEDEDHRVLLAEGPVELHAPTSRLEDAWASRIGTRPEWAVCFIELRPERVFSYSAS
jgi:hypothetical protein